MTARAPSSSPRASDPALWLLPALALLAAMSGCAAAARIDVPAELPLQVNDQLFAIRWALQREASVVRAVGRVTPSISAEAQLTLAFFGLDAEGRIVSRGTAYLRSDFGSRSIAFAVELTPTGRESTFVLRVLDSHVPGLRTN